MVGTCRHRGSHDHVSLTHVSDPSVRTVPGHPTHSRLGSSGASGLAMSNPAYGDGLDPAWDEQQKRDLR